MLIQYFALGFDMLKPITVSEDVRVEIENRERDGLLLFIIMVG